MNYVTWQSEYVWVFIKDKTVKVRELLCETESIMPFAYCE